MAGIGLASEELPILRAHPLLVMVPVGGFVMTVPFFLSHAVAEGGRQEMRVVTTRARGQSDYHDPSSLKCFSRALTVNDEIKPEVRGLPGMRGGYDTLLVCLRASVFSVTAVTPTVIVASLLCLLRVSRSGRSARCRGERTRMAASWPCLVT